MTVSFADSLDMATLSRQITPGIVGKTTGRISLDSLELDAGRIAAPAANAQGVRAYRGLSYAAAPLGHLRWSPPAPITPWSGLRPTDQYGDNALQGAVFDDIDPFTIGVSEDCLYLNVWTPCSPGGANRLPVMFWIHGGGFVVGSGSEPRYDGSALAARGIVVVTINHRLNALGYLAHPELTREHGASGAWGMLDIVAALQWVRRNIAAFGGDPDQVTIAGESAGSMAVSGLMASPLARGLFARAIGQSGALFPSPAEPLASLEKAERDGAAFLSRLGVKTVAQARALPAEAILAAAPSMGFRPIIDGAFLPRPPVDIFGDGEQNDVALMAGWTKDEGFNFTWLKGGEPEGAYEALAHGRFGPLAEAVLTHYPAGAHSEASARALGGDIVIIHKTWAWIEAQKATGHADLFRFRFERAPLTPQGWFGERDSQTAGAFHASDITYVFDTLDATPWKIDAADRALAKTVTAYWLNFVKNGDPNGPGLPPWPSFRATSEVMLLDEPARASNEQQRERQEFLRTAVGGEAR